MKTFITISKDGDKFCCLHGTNLQEGVAGFGDTIKEAIKDYVTNFIKHIVLKDAKRDTISQADLELFVNMYCVIK